MVARAFGRVDAAVLLVFAAAAVVAAGVRDREFRKTEAIDRRTGLRPEQIARRPDWLCRLDAAARRVDEDLKVLLVVATAGVGTVVLRRRALFREPRWPGPGIIAGLVGAASLVYCVILVAVSFGSSAPWARLLHRQWFHTVFVMSEGAQAGAIVGAWTFLAVTRSWRPRRADWDDRIGRFVGWTWIGAYGFDILYPAIWT